MPDTGAISVVINTLNEEANIGACIDSVADLAAEIVVCDMHSDDRTAEIARQKGARVVLHPRAGFVEPARRFAIEHARHEWILVLDADERMTPTLASRLREIVREGGFDVVSFWSLYWYFGGWVRHGGFFSGNWRRLFRKSIYLDEYSEAEERVHRNFECLARARRVLRLPREFYIEHYAYPSVEKYVTKTLGTYARIEAEQHVGDGGRFSPAKMIWEPVREFGLRFLLLAGYRDGMRGLVLASLYAGYRFCVWANVWFLRSGGKG